MPEHADAGPLSPGAGAPTPSPGGPLMIIGGAEDKLRRRTILKDFVAAGGGADARLVVIPTASSLGDDVVEVYDALFRRLGAGDVAAVRPESRDDAHDPALVALIDAATGVFMTGGNQLKLSAIICGTPLGDAVVRAHERGAVVGRYVGRRQHPVVPHGRLRRRRSDPQAADDPGRRRAGTAAHDGDRPALRPAQPLRPAVDDRVAVAAAARHRRRRGHVRDRDRRGGPRGPACDRPRCGHHPRPATAGHERLRGQAVLSPPGQRHHPPRPAGRRGVRPDDAGAPAAARPGLGGGRRRARRGPGRSPADGPRHRRRRPLAGHPAATSGPQAHTPQDCPHRPLHRTPHPTHTEPHTEPQPAGDIAEQDGASR